MGMVGLEITSAPNCIAGHSKYGLEVLSGATARDCEQARAYAAASGIHVYTKNTVKSCMLYVEAHVYATGHEAVCVIEDAHTNITRVQLGTVLEKLGCTEELNLSALPHQDFRNIELLFEAFVEKKPVHGLSDGLPLFPTINICMI